jgi:hypothetical protein
MRIFLAKGEINSKKGLTRGAFIVLIPLLVLFAAIAGVIYYNSQQGPIVPQRITTGNFSTTTAAIAWITPENDTTTLIEWGETPNLGKTSLDSRDVNNIALPRKTHFVALEDLEPDAEYYYRIKVGNTYYPDTNEAPYTFKTLNSVENVSQRPISIYGNVKSPDNKNADTLVTVFAESNGIKSLPIITTVKDDGAWYINLSEAVPSEESEDFQINTDTQISVVYDGGNKGQKEIATPANSPLSANLNPEFSFATLYADVHGTNNVNTSVVPTQLTSGPLTTTTPTQTVSRFRQDVALLPVEGSVTVITTTPADETGTPKLSEEYSTPIISNVTDSSYTVLWLTADKTESKVVVGTSQSTATQTFYDDRSIGSRTTLLHHVTVKQLTPLSVYTYSYGTTQSTFTTPRSIAEQISFQTISGTIANASGECYVRTSVQNSQKRSAVITTLIDSQRHFSFNLGPIRTADYNAFFKANGSDIVIMDAVCISQGPVIRKDSLSLTLKQAMEAPINFNVK